MLTVAPSQPEVFANPAAAWAARPGAAKAINEDGTVNTAENPARLGSVVSIWVTGAGAMSKEKPDGTIVTGDLGKPALPVSMMSFGQDPRIPQAERELIYVGDAPSMVRGVVQINFRLPREPERSGPIEQIGSVAKIGDAVSKDFFVWICPEYPGTRPCVSPKP